AQLHDSDRVGKEMQAYCLLQCAHTERQRGSLVQALDYYDRSISLCESLNFPRYLYQAHKGRLSCYIGLGDITNSEAETGIVLKIVEDNRSAIVDLDNRYNFADVEQSVYDLAIQFETTALGNHERAFNLSESSRARTLFEQVVRNRAKRSLLAGEDSPSG